MTTVLFADRDGASLGPLGERVVPALLPLQSVPALERMLEALVRADLRAALLVVGPRSREIQRRFGKGIRWGIALEYVEREAEESPGDVLRRLEPRLDGDTLVFRGDVGAHAAVGEFVDAVASREGPVVAGTAGGRPVGFYRLKPGAVKKVELPREPSAEGWALGEDHEPLPLGTPVTLLDSVASYRAADAPATPAVSPRASVDPKAKLLPGTTVAEESVVLAGARLSGVSVLPRTLVPANVELADAVVSGNLVVDARTGEASLLTDRLPASPPRRAPGATDRLAGLLALVLSLPLWPIAFFWALVANAGHATRKVRLNGNGAGGAREPFSTFRFETAVPLLRDLPLLLALSAGRLALTGVAPLPPEEEAALREGWERTRLEAPAGLLCASRLLAPASAPDEVARVVDAFEARRPVGGLVGTGLSALFGARGWVAPKAWNPDQIPEASS